MYTSLHKFGQSNHLRMARGMLPSVSGSGSTFIIVVLSLGPRSEEWPGRVHILNVRNGLGMSEAEPLASLANEGEIGQINSTMATILHPLDNELNSNPESSSL